MVGVWRWRGFGGGGAGLAAFRAACAFLLRGGRCACCAGRRLHGQGCLARCCARQGFWSRQCSPGSSAVAVLGEGGDMPVVATTGAVVGS